MIYAASFDHKIHENEVPGNARRSAIDEVAWGWTVPDLWRAILPWFRIDRTVDRGWALEKKWAAINNLDDSGGSAGTMLSDWSEAARNGTVPALVMNAMLVERGQPVVFSTTRFPAHRDQDNRTKNFYRLDPDRYRQYDIRVNTAARLSASFPYVAPASRPNLDAPYGKGFHVVDGGYYDNFGITTLLAWLNEALADAEVRRELADILILQIRHFNPKKLNDAQTQGWGFQIAAPPFALANMRDFAQDSVARNQLEFFGKYYEEKKVNVWQTSIAYTGVDRCADTPLSWKLDQDQQHCITGAWDAVLKDQTKALRCIDSYVHGRDLGVDCARAAQGKE